MKFFFRFFLVFSLVLASYQFGCCQKTNDNINAKEAERIEIFLASDELRGRKAGSPEIDKAALFISEEFKKAGLQPLSGNSFLQDFSMIRPRFKSVKAEMDDVEIESRNVIVITSETDLKVNEKSGYEIHYIKAGDNLNTKALGFIRANKNVTVFVDTSFSKNFSRLTNFKRQLFKSAANVIFVLGNYSPKEFTIKAEHTIEESNFKNVVGILSGKSKKMNM